MAKNKAVQATEEAVQDTEVVPTTEVVAEPKSEKKLVAYPVEYLKENAAHFGTYPEVVAGALVGKKTATEEETKAAIKAYLETPKAVKEKQQEKGAEE